MLGATALRRCHRSSGTRCCWTRRCASRATAGARTGRNCANRIKEESPWWVPGAVDHAFQRKLETAIQRLMDEVKAEPYHPLRPKFDDRLPRFRGAAQASPGDRAPGPRRSRANCSGILRWTNSPPRCGTGPGTAAERLTEDADSQALAAARPRHQRGRGDRSLANTDRLAELDEFLTNFAAVVLEQHRHEVGDADRGDGAPVGPGGGRGAAGARRRAGTCSSSG